MRGIRARALAAALVVAGAIVLAAVLARGDAGSRASSAPALRQEPAGEEHEKKEQRELDVRLHSDSSGKIRPDLFRKSLKDFGMLKIDASRELPAAGASTTQSGVSASSAGGGGVVGAQWTQIGPAPLIIDAEQNYQGQGPDAGQVVSLAIDPRNAADAVIYAAFNDGGVWKTTDGGASWKPKTDYMPTLSIGAVALDPANPSIVYAGTGNLYNNGYFKAIGVYRSTDAGDTWSLTGGSSALNGRGVNFIAMPAANALLVATNQGLFRSTNSGGMFTQVSVGGTTNAFITDLDLDTQNPNTVYAAVSGQGIFVSTDGGQTFPVSSNLFGNGTGGPTTPYLFVSFAQSTTASGDVMYANAQNNGAAGSSNFNGMWKSTDGGANWSDLTSAANPGARLDKCQCGYDQTIGVDPVDENKVYIGFQELWYSSDGGGSFANVSDGKIHWDHHALVFSPPGHRASGDTTTRVWAGTDGGVHYADDAGGSWTQRNGKIATNLFRAMDIGRGAANNGYSYGGAQDTGTMRHKPSDSGTEWHESVNADGGPMAVDWQNPDNAFGISNGQFIRTTNGGDSWSRPGSGDINCMPMSAAAAVDPNDGRHVYVPTNGGSLNTTPCAQSLGAGIFRSFDGGATFAASDFVAAPGGRIVTFIGTTPTDSNLVWVALCTPVPGGCTPGAVAVSTNFQAATPAFTLKTVAGAPTANPIAIAIDAANTDTVVVVYPGFSSTAPNALSKHVFMTTDGGGSWADIGGTALDPDQMVPDMPLYSVVIDPQTTPHSIIVSTDLGVLRTLDNGATWQILGIGLPNVNATSLQIDSTVTPSLLRVGTYGRSAFELTTATGALLAVNCNLGFGFVTVGTTANRQCQLFNVGSADLHVNGVFRASGSTRFTVASGPPTPVTIAAGSHVDYTVAFSPTSPGDQAATFQINSDDPFQPTLQIPASGTGVTGNINVSPLTLAYGGVAVDNRTDPSTKTLTTTLSNQASCAFCDLHVTALSITGGNAGDFEMVGAPAVPFTLAAGNSVNLSVRFNPSVGGPRAATLTITSDDPVQPSVAVALAGTGLKPAIDADPGTLIFPPTVFDPACGTVCGSTLPEKLTNTGEAELIVDEVSFTGPFSGLAATTPPTRIQPGSILTEQVTFHPVNTSARKVTGSLHVQDSFPLQLPANIVAKDVPLCGESVGRGIRVLVVDKTGNPAANVDMLRLTANGVSSLPNINLKNLPLQTIDPPTSCRRIQMQYENQNLSSTNQTAPKSSYYTLTAAVGNKKSTLTFGLAVNEFKLVVVTVG